MYGQTPSEKIFLADVIDPDVTVASTVTTAWLPADDAHQWLAVILAGTLGTSATVDAKIEQGQTVSGTNAKDLTGSAITQLTQAGTDSDKQALIQFNTEQLDIANSFDHFRLSVTVAVATSDLAAFVIGLTPKYKPASQFDASTVDEIVTV